MALKQIGVRTEGDVYQGLFFWKQAADLLRPESMVECVELEHDEAKGVDDVAVFYRAPGVDAGGWLARADYFQIKYHIDNRSAYSADALIDPIFISAKSSLLQRFYNTYNCLSRRQVPFRLHLVSNWQWKSDDKLAPFLREYDGALPDKFFEDGPLGDLGKIREKWRNHLNLETDVFVEFARTLRLQFSYFGRREFKSYVYAKLNSAGLRTPSADRAACPYESLVQQFLMNGLHSFKEAEFRSMCQREDLLLDAEVRQPRPFSIAVRSFMRFTERLESEVDEFVCVSSNFSGRHLARGGSWDRGAKQVLMFLGDAVRRVRLRAVESVIALECHGSFALLSGWELSRNAGTKVAPLQKPNLSEWRPSENAALNPSWAEPQTIEKNPDAEDVVLCLSVTQGKVIKTSVTRGGMVKEGEHEVWIPAGAFALALEAPFRGLLPKDVQHPLP